jgi:isocitrate dehydrogenase kinase/phosphatase
VEAALQARSDSEEERASQVALAIFAAYDRFDEKFQEITSRAQQRFESRDWRGSMDDSLQRLDVYQDVLDDLVASLRQELGPRLRDRSLWSRARKAYAKMTEALLDSEIAETFFNSTTRRIFTTVGVDPRIEFVAPRPKATQPEMSCIYTEYSAARGIEAVLRQILADQPFTVGYQDLERDCRAAAKRIEEHLQGRPLQVVQMVSTPFYRGQRAYLIGRMWSGGRLLPLLLVLTNPQGSLVLDAVLLEEDDVSKVFSFTRSYYRVDTRCPSLLVGFLKSILPRKPVAELYISIGYNRHGKTELYRDFARHLKHHHDRFEIAPGEKGMVMVVFTLPSYDVVFKVIRDRFAEPKSVTREQVRDRYRLVFKHDRVGRLVDAQEFEHIRFHRRRFSPQLLEELIRSASRTVRVDGDTVVIGQAYTERRVTPLNLYLRQVSAEAARAAVLDFGRCIKELGAANIFPGDMFLKNFGVTRHGRVVFYDYDELCFVTECNFRELPQAGDPDDELSGEPYFYVGPNDVFPEEFRRFLGLDGELRRAFEEAHGDLFSTAYWNAQKEKLQAGEIPDVSAYPESRRLAFEP